MNNPGDIIDYDSETEEAPLKPLVDPSSEINPTSSPTAAGDTEATLPDQIELSSPTVVSRTQLSIATSSFATHPKSEVAISSYVTANPSTTTLHLNPLHTLHNYDKDRGFWGSQSFNEALTLPSLPGLTKTRQEMGGTLLMTFRALAVGDVIVSLSPTPSFEIEKSYALCFGASGNLKCFIKRRTRDDEGPSVETPGRVCDGRNYVRYWVAVDNLGKISMGVNEDEKGGAAQPKDGVKVYDPEHFALNAGSEKPFFGRNTLSQLDDCLYNQLRPPSDRVRYVGLGNNLGRARQGEKGLGRNPFKICDVELRYLTKKDYISPLRDSDKDGKLYKVDVGSDAVKGSAGAGGFTEEMNDALLEEWGVECQKIRKRAEKFGHEYKLPGVETFLKWSEAKRLRSNPTPGFITGMDIHTDEEEKKKKDRAARFEADRKKHAKRGREEGEMDEGDEGEAVPENAVLGVVTTTVSPPIVLPASHAYTNDRFCTRYRVDPPANLLEELTGIKQLQKGSVGGVSADSMVDNPFSLEEEPVPASVILEKIHLFTLDYAAFKQLRTADILGHFSEYGPSYVEWLGEFSCNVFFEDRWSCKRALEGVGQVIPKMNDRASEEGVAMLEEVESNMTDAREGGLLYSG